MVPIDPLHAVGPLHAIGPLHGGARLPMALDTASLVLAVGALVFGLVVYDAYRTYWG